MSIEKVEYTKRPKMWSCFKDWNLVSQGAEAKVYIGTFHGRKSAIKERVSKSYRHPQLDNTLSHQRLLLEARCMVRCQRAGVDTPSIYFIDEDRFLLVMEFIEGTTVKEYLWSFQNDTSRRKELAIKVGESIAKMHAIGIVHGDLTTSNLMIREKKNTLVIIDFGLGSSAGSTENKAVDLYVLERALQSTHINADIFFNDILTEYRDQCLSNGVSMKEIDSILKHFEKVRLRGRKRIAFG